MSEEKVSLSKSVLPSEAQPGEAGYVPPTELVPLPSQGKIYGEDSPLHLKEGVEIRSMTARDEDILTSRALLKQGKAIGTLLRSCILNKTVNPDEMVVGDRNAILIAIRITGYGEGYRVTVECPKCEEKNKHEFNLKELAVKPLGMEPTSPGKNEFQLNLPVSKKVVRFKLLSGQDESDLATAAEKKKKAGIAVDTLVTSRLHASVISIGTESDRAKLEGIIRNLPARDSRFLRTEMERIAPGVDMEQEFTCASCGESSTVEVPMGMEFFWPSGE